MSAREQILRAADTLFGDIGFDATTTRRIGDLSGVNKALIHYHFASKEELFERVIDGYYERLGLVLRESLSSGGPLRERMERVVDAYADFLAENLSFCRMVQREASGGRHVERITAHMAPIFATGASLLEETLPGARSGPLSAPHLLVSFYGMVVTYFTYAPVLEGLLGGDPLSPAALAIRKQHLRRMIDVTLREIDGEARGSKG